MCPPIPQGHEVKWGQTGGGYGGESENEKEEAGGEGGPEGTGQH